MSANDRGTGGEKMQQPQQWEAQMFVGLPLEHALQLASFCRRDVRTAHISPESRRVVFTTEYKPNRLSLVIADDRVIAAEDG